MTGVCKGKHGRGDVIGTFEVLLAIHVRNVLYATPARLQSGGKFPQANTSEITTKSDDLVFVILACWFLI
jgi:hypothetical protein